MSFGSAPNNKKDASETLSARSYVLRQQVANIDKWNTLLNNNSRDSSSKQLLSNSSKQTSPALPCGRECHRASSKGKAAVVCTVCMRKFQSMEQLRRHENLSQLHKSNVRRKTTELRKRQKDSSRQSKKPTAGSVIQYVDRAKKRRILYEGVHIAVLQAPQRPAWLRGITAYP